MTKLGPEEPMRPVNRQLSGERSRLAAAQSYPSYQSQSGWQDERPRSTRVAGRDGWTTLALVIDCHTRELLGWHLSGSGKATTAACALEHALINRFGTLGKVTRAFLLRSDNGLAFASRKHTGLVRNYGLRQEFITPHCP